MCDNRDTHEIAGENIDSLFFPTENIVPFYKLFNNGMMLISKKKQWNDAFLL